MDKRLKTFRQRRDKAIPKMSSNRRGPVCWGSITTRRTTSTCTPQLLFEFKYERKLANASQLAPVLAQLMPAAARAAESESPGLHTVTMHAVLPTRADVPCWKN